MKLEKVDLVIHLASEKIPRYGSSFHTLSENHRINRSVIDYCVQQQARLFAASTSDVYGKNPEVPYTEESNLVLGPSSIRRWAYAVSKLELEHLCFGAAESLALRFQIMRFFGCYGPRQARGWWGGPQSVFFEQALQKQPLELHGDGTQTRSFIYIDDLVQGVLTLIETEVPDNQIWNICQNPSEEISILNLAKMIWSLVNPNETPSLKWVPYSTFGPYEDVIRRTGLSDKLTRFTGWRPGILLAEGLQKTFDWVNAQKHKPE